MQRLTFEAAGQVEGRTLSGTAHVYGAITIDGRQMSFAPGAFTQSIAAGKVVSMVGHEESKLLASQQAGTLRLSDSPTGLGFAIDLPQGVSYAEDLRTLAERGEPISMSFQFVPSAPPKRIKGLTVWTAGRLLSVDPVAAAAFEGSQVILSSVQPETRASQLIKIHERVLAESARVSPDA